MQLNRLVLRSLQMALASTTLGVASQPAFASGSAVEQDGTIVILTRIDRQSAILPEPISVPRRTVEVAVDTSPDDLLVATMSGADARVGDAVPDALHSITGNVGVRGGRIATTPSPVRVLGAVTPRAGQAVASRIGSTMGNGTPVANRTPAVSVPAVSVVVPPVRVDVPAVSVPGPAPASVNGILAATDELLAGERLAPIHTPGNAAAMVQFTNNATGAAIPAATAAATSALSLDSGSAVAATLGTASAGRIADTVTDAVRPISAATSGIGAQISGTLGTLGARIGAQR